MVKIINLNKKLVTKQDLLTKIDDVDIYRFYTGKEIVFGGMLSPLRPKEKNKSFGYFIGESGEVCFKDFVLGVGDCIKLVQLLFGYNYFEALSQIVVDFNLTDDFLYKENIVKSKVNKNDTIEFMDRNELIQKNNNFELKKKKRDWQLHDLVYWSTYGISLDTLKRYRVEPIEYIFINGSPIKTEKYAYCFIEKKDNTITYKIYQPFSEKYKWINNHDSSTWQGWDQLPKTGKQLIITKSLKDVMSINEMLGIPAVSLQAESTKPKEHIIEELKDRFEVIHLLYDNDYDKEKNWGQIFAQSLIDDYGFSNLIIPNKFKSKDFSDLVKNVNKASLEFFPDAENDLTLTKKVKTLWECNIYIPF